MSKSIQDARIVLADFFGDQDAVRLGEDPRTFPTYVPDEDGARILALRDESHPDSSDVRSAAHEIGHFILAPRERLALPDYGYPTVTDEQWPAAWWRAEFDVFAVQAIILRRHRRHAAVAASLEDAAMFLEYRGKRYIASDAALAQAHAEADPFHVNALLKNHLIAQIERRIERREAGYAGILAEFFERCRIVEKQSATTKRAAA